MLLKEINFKFIWQKVSILKYAESLKLHGKGSQVEEKNL